MGSFRFLMVRLYSSFGCRENFVIFLASDSAFWISLKSLKTSGESATPPGRRTKETARARYCMVRYHLSRPSCAMCWSSQPASQPASQQQRCPRRRLVYAIGALVRRRSASRSCRMAADGRGRKEPRTVVSKNLTRFARVSGTWPGRLACADARGSQWGSRACGATARRWAGHNARLTPRQRGWRFRRR
eukprot:COSAG06_NODE_3819_length_4875_cov_7.735553_2_plen_189_part_00